MTEPVRILLVEDLPTDAELAEREIRKAVPSCVFELVDNQTTYLTALARFQPDLIITDYRMPQFDGLTALKLALEHAPLTPVIVLTGAINEETAVACMKAGATDYVIKEHIKRLGQAVLHALQEGELRHRNKKAEQALQEKTEELDRFFTLALDMLCIADTDGYFHRLNPQWETVLGYSLSELEGHKFLDFVHPDDRDSTLATLSELNAQKTILDFVNRYRCQDGSYRWIEWRSYPAGNLIYSAARDITEHKRIEEALRESEFFLRKSQSVAQIGSYYLDIKTGHWISSPALDNIFAIDESYPKNIESWLLLVHPECREEMSQHLIEHVIAKRNRFDKEYRIARQKDGQERWVHGLGELEFDENGEVTKMIGTIQDITERRQTEAALRLTQTAVDRARDGIHWVGPDGELIYVNDALCQSLGYTREELLSMTIFDIDPFFPREIRQERWENERQLENNLFETYHKAKDGRLIPVEVSAERINFGGIEFNCAYSRDITERRQSEQIIQLRLKLMEYAVDHSLKDLLQKTLDEIGTLTNSPIGFYHFVAEDQKTLILQAWSTKTSEEFCQAEGEGLHYPIDEAGIWADCARERRAVVHNDYMAVPHRKGLPDGHAQLVRELVVPILRSDNIVAILGVGNKPHNYTEKDVEIVSYVADLVWEIVEHKRAEEAVKQKQALLDESQQLAHIGSWDLDLKTRQFIWTDETYRILGFAPQEFQPTIEDFFAAIHPNDRAIIMEKYSEAMATKKFDDVDYRVIRPDGTSRWIHATGRVYTDDTAVTSRIVGTVQDITERWQTERDLHLTRFSVDNVADAVYWIDLEAQITGVNDTACRMLGYTRAELKQMSLTDIDPGFSLVQWANTWQRLRELKKLTIESQHLTKDGRIIPIEIVANFIDFNGRELNCAVVRDITERKQAEEALQLTQFCVDHASIGIFLTDQDGRIRSVNHQACHSLGYTEAELCDKFIFEIDPSFNPERWSKHRQNLSSRGSINFETIHQHKDGTIFPVEITVSYLEFQGEELGYSFVRDISERKQAEETQAKLEEQLRQAQKLESIGRLAGGIAHDFNNLLVPIVGYAELGQMILDPGNRVHSYLEKIRMAADRASGLTKQILAFSRRQMLEMALFDLNEVIDEFQEMLRRLIGEDIQVNLFLTSASCLVKADQTQIEQILLNLIVNARDAMPDGGQLIIETDNVYLDEAYAQTHSETQPGHYVMLSISDTGHGMDNETQERIFEPFFTTKERGKGTGLGLATVFGIVKQHQGNIWVYSEPGKGTTFKIYLPRAEEAAPIAEFSTSELPTIYGTETIMIAEDEPMVRKLANETLAAYGYTVIETGSAQEALQLAAAHPGDIDLLLTDVIMPEMNGRELYEKMHTIRPNLKVLYVSGYTDNVIVHHGVLDEGVNFLQKPFTVRGLAKKIRQVLS